MKKIIFITGVSSGFGRATSKLLAEAGHSVYGTIRKEALSDDLVHIIKMDLTDYQSVKSAVDTVISREGRIDVLINNAGMHTGGPIETTREENIRLQMETNFNGMVNLTQQVLPIMRSQGGGTIINFSSIGGLIGLPFQSFYSASKFAIEGFSEALRMEVKRFNIKVIVINPGDFCTSNSANRRNYLTPTEEGDPYKDQFARTLSIIEKDEANGWHPDVLAGKLLKIIEYKNPRQRYVVSSFEQRLALMLKYILPGSIFRKILEGHYQIK